MAEDAPREIAAMDEWAATCGVQRADGVELILTECDNYGNGIDSQDVSVVTTQDLPAKSPVLCVPSDMILTSDRAVAELGRQEDAEKLLGSLNAATPDHLRHFYLFLKILVEYEKGPDSPWYPWLNALPRYYSNGASMTDICFECLPPLVSALALKERANCNAFLAAIYKVPFLSDNLVGNKDIGKWAFQAAYTRSFEYAPEPDENSDEEPYVDYRIVPMIDMLNHGTETEVAISYDDEGNGYAHTTCDVPAGSPLRMSYGDPTNPSCLFARYGFVDETAPATFCKIMIPHVNDKLVDMGYVPNRMLFYKDTGEVSGEVWDVLLYQLLSANNASYRRQLYNAHVNGDMETKQNIHEHFYPETAGKLQDHIDTFLSQLDKLTAKGVGKELSEHPRLPLILKHNDFVRQTFMAVRNRHFEQ